jgi:hypothetical protein
MSLFMKSPSISSEGTALQREVDTFQWHHEIDFGDGVRTRGACKLRHLRAQADVYFAGDLVKGRSFLDVGCWDGYNCLEACRRGARRVLATDHFRVVGSMLGEPRRIRADAETSRTVD